VVALETAFGNFDRANIGFGVVEFVCEGDGLGHFQLQPLIPRRGGLRCASHELNYTRIARKRKNFFENFSRGHGETASGRVKRNMKPIRMIIFSVLHSFMLTNIITMSESH